VVEEVVRRLLNEPWSFVNEKKVRGFVARLGTTATDLDEWEKYMRQHGEAAAHAKIQRQQSPGKEKWPRGAGGWLSQVGDEW
jgi:hypothetical protein